MAQKMYKMITNCEIYDMDYKTQMALGYPNIPANTEVDYLGSFDNYYGHFVKVKYNDIVYYTQEKNLRSPNKND